LLVSLLPVSLLPLLLVSVCIEELLAEGAAAAADLRL
jgi:hypothetical protein